LNFGCRRFANIRFGSFRSRHDKIGWTDNGIFVLHSFQKYTTQQFHAMMDVNKTKSSCDFWLVLLFFSLSLSGMGQREVSCVD
jgi:hypothetical protein